MQARVGCRDVLLSCNTHVPSLGSRMTRSAAHTQAVVFIHARVHADVRQQACLKAICSPHVHSLHVTLRQVGCTTVMKAISCQAADLLEAGLGTWVLPRRGSLSIGSVTIDFPLNPSGSKSSIGLDFFNAEGHHLQTLFMGKALPEGPYPCHRCRL